jgi:hypothetical protein
MSARTRFGAFSAAAAFSCSGAASWCITTDPEFGPKAADIVGLYLNPPENAVVVCIDEKPHIQALQRAQCYLRLPNGRAVNGFSHCYKRHGTTTLFAALDVVSILWAWAISALTTKTRVFRMPKFPPIQERRQKRAGATQ